MERLIDKIREKFPTPIRFREIKNQLEDWCPEKHGYCVGFAAMNYFGFPDTIKMIMHFNPKMNEGEAKDLFREIAQANDSGNFELAWELLAQAIEGKP